MIAYVDKMIAYADKMIAYADKLIAYADKMIAYADFQEDLNQIVQERTPVATCVMCLKMKYLKTSCYYCIKYVLV